jgi:methyl-accepting chemotaxis protein
MKIRTKLFIGFGIIIMTGCVVTLTALFAISSLSSNIDELLGRRMPQLQTVADIQEAIYTSAIHIDEAIMADGIENVNAELDATTVNRKATNENMEKLKTSLSTDRGKALYQMIIDKRAPYVAKRDKLIALSREGKTEEARQGLAELKPLRKAFIDALKDLDRYVQEQAGVTRVTTVNNAGTARIGILSMMLAMLVIAVIVMLWIVRSITRPLNAAVATANRIAEKDLTVQVDASDATETGQLMAALQNMVQNLRDMISKTVDISTGIASASNQLQSTSAQIATGAEELASQAHTVATSSEEMSATSSDIARNCTMAAEASRQTTESANAGSVVVQETITGMNVIADRVRKTSKTIGALGARSEQIGDIVGTIEDIADQTNLLALNAAIEAARAGEQGRGFAVVADEVRALAERTTKATREIGEMIKAIQKETQEAVKAMEEGVNEVEKGAKSSQKSGHALAEILERINEVTMQVNQIATAAEEQTATTGEVTGNIQQITEVVHQTARGADETASAAAQLAGQAQDLQNLVSRFRLA